VQSESFFDPRRLLDTVDPKLLTNFDHIRTHAELHGTLQVPAWGANTMRTEFGFLTGIAADDLGIHRFNPYRKIARHPTSSLASVARALGYRTVCIHPHPASFFDRDSVYPNLGFDEFIDIEQFDATETCGPYVCDAAVGRMIGRQLASSNRAVFVFAITMENHGPLHLEKAEPGDSKRCYRTPPPAGFDDLTVYLRHLANADRMLGGLTTLLSQQQREGLLCWFGDHVPSLPRVYAALEFMDGRTDYLLWRTRHRRVEYRDLAVEDLGQALLKAMLLEEPQ
jgi:phosphoglycerol transferase MdoB-like AlkP superfamily enzyme